MSPRNVVGTSLHGLVVMDHAGGRLPLRDLTGQRFGLAFLPGAFTPVCTRELPALEELWARLGECGIPLLAATCDAPPVLRAWRDAESLQMPLLSDFWPHGTVARAVDAFDESSGRARRVSVVVDAECRVAARFEGDPDQPRDLDRLAHALVDR